jgi:hypothetical protein
MEIKDKDASHVPIPGGNSAEAGKSAAGVSPESVGAMVGAIVGAATARIVKSPKGENVKIAEELLAGAQTAGAVILASMVAGRDIGNASELLNGAGAASRKENHATTTHAVLTDTYDRERREASDALLAAKRAAEEDDYLREERSSGQGL